MKHQRTPYSKKQDEYEKDHRVHAEYPHTFRRIWPKKKACANRKERRKVLALAQQLLYRNAADQLSISLLKTAKPEINKYKTGVVTLREMTQWKLQQRREKYGTRIKRRERKMITDLKQ